MHGRRVHVHRRTVEMVCACGGTFRVERSEADEHGCRWTCWSCRASERRMRASEWGD
jgi:hypothetical protein